jgi:CheY-like chemotaxis protein/HPt (histidine-containing phosphotransfer) domain-containing protein
MATKRDEARGDEGDGRTARVPLEFMARLYRELYAAAGVLGDASNDAAAARLKDLAEESLRHVASARKDPPSEAGSGTPLLEGRRIMVVEDNELNAFVAMRYLAREGAQPLLARSGREALAKLEAADLLPELVLIDIQMPDMNGLELAWEIRRRPRYEGIPLFALTADQTVATRDRARGVGMDAYFQKPINFAFLAQVIADRLRGQGASALFLGAGRPDTPEAAAPASCGEFDELLSQDSAAELMGSKELYAMALRAFRDEGPSMLKRAESDHAAGRGLDCSRAVHSLKGLAGTVGASRLYAKLIAAEAQLRSQDRLGPEEFACLSVIMADTVGAIDRLLERA